MLNDFANPNLDRAVLTDARWATWCDQWRWMGPRLQEEVFVSDFAKPGELYYKDPGDDITSTSSRDAEDAAYITQLEEVDNEDSPSGSGVLLGEEDLPLPPARPPIVPIEQPEPPASAPPVPYLPAPEPPTPPAVPYLPAPQPIVPLDRRQTAAHGQVPYLPAPNPPAPPETPRATPAQVREVIFSCRPLQLDVASLHRSPCLPTPLTPGSCTGVTTSSQGRKGRPRELTTIS